MLTWMITGSSRGLGRALAESTLESGDNVALTARDPEAVADLVARYPDRALPLALDVTNPQACHDAVAAVEERFGRIDVLVNNAGYGYRSAIEEGEEEDVRGQFETHFFGPLRLIRATLPGMRLRRSGAIVNVSSIAARFIAPGSGYYAASKLALEGLSFTLREEVSPLGIDVLTVEPGPFRTNFLGTSLKQSASAIDDYALTAGARRKERIAGSAPQPGDPAKAAQVIIEAVRAPRTPRIIALGELAIEAFARSAAELQADVDEWAPRARDTSFE